MYLPRLLVAAIALVAADLSAADDLFPFLRFPAGVIVDPEEAVVPLFLGRALSGGYREDSCVHDMATTAQEYGDANTTARATQRSREVESGVGVEGAEEFGK